MSTKQLLRRTIALAGVRTLARFIARRAHVRPSLWRRAENDNFPIEAWHG